VPPTGSVSAPVARAELAGPRARRSLHVWGWYVGALGVALNVTPNALLTLFLLPPTTEVWVRMVGMFLLFLAYLSFASSREGNAGYMRWSVHVRLAVPAFFVTYVALGWAPVALLPFGAVDVAGALWTQWALAKDARG
jgi:hypothetical protein